MENPKLDSSSSFDTPETLLLREKMVQEQIAGRGIRDERILAAFLKVPRHIFLPEEVRHLSYEDRAIPIGEEQSISQPYIVAYIVDRLQISSADTVLEIGTGSGYLSAILDAMGAKILSVEIFPELRRRAVSALEAWSPGFTNRNRILEGDALLLTKGKTRFTKFVSSACFPKIPSETSPLFDSLEENGIAVLPVELKENFQFLLTLKKEKGRLIETNRLSVKFVPLLGRTEIL
ncbi:protein-L-isoaspartate O-methyltransferase [Leptospira langatensis]|uniref:Protein-L-isoaspartate O-methyltransferase n=1 Tax=Leptospira langatensis TaxID=2484983 RepID=A0A5F1ZTQ8_9LEPT|nr:protein-L-isoaspartate O-methyltransferase [Leptospira langatensis]TGK02571.1 protein-L-isoaspartate O-methyltransferase [Leptospira langatensis]TGL40228.1 protein-L-isoaspartate O-methyltransferase [Leptospira langatensis]